MQQTKSRNGSSKGAIGKKKRKKIITILTYVFLAGTFVFFGTSIISQNADISRLQKQKAEIQVEYDEQTQANEELKEVLENENKDNYIERRARENGYVKSDEIVFYDISAAD